MSRTTTLPAPIVVSSPMRTPGQTMLPPPIQTWAPIVIGRASSGPATRVRIPRMVGGQELDVGAEHGLLADADRRRVQEHAVHVDERARGELDLRAVVAVEGRLDHRARPQRAEQIPQQGELLLRRVRGRGVQALPQVAGAQPGRRQLRVRGEVEVPPQHPGALAVHRNRHGFRSSDALPLSTSKGTDWCSWVIVHLPPAFRRQTVARTHMPTAVPSVIVPLTR
jgi:hypothetical protein